MTIRNCPPHTIGGSNRIAVTWSQKHTVSENDRVQRNPTRVGWEPKLLTTTLTGLPMPKWTKNQEKKKNLLGLFMAVNRKLLLWPPAQIGLKWCSFYLLVGCPDVVWGKQFIAHTSIYWRFHFHIGSIQIVAICWSHWWPYFFLKISKIYIQTHIFSSSLNLNFFQCVILKTTCFST